MLRPYQPTPPELDPLRRVLTNPVVVLAPVLAVLAYGFAKMAGLA
jgi:hypothetical protein